MSKDDRISGKGPVDKSDIYNRRLNRRLDGKILGLLAGLVLLVYANTFNSPFYFDDLRSILNNHSIRLESLSFDHFAKVISDSPLYRRPVANISFAFNYYLHQYHVTGYHVVNLLIHILSGFWLFYILKTTLKFLGYDRHDTLPEDSRLSGISGIDKPGRNQNDRAFSSVGTATSTHIAFFATALWLVHPIQTQSVTYIVQRMNGLAVMFYLLSLLLYINGRLIQRRRAGQTSRGVRLFLSEFEPQAAENPNPETKDTPTDSNFRPNWQTYLCFAGSAICGLCALGSKEIAATLPVVIFLYEWYFFQRLSWSWIKVWIWGLLIIAGLLLIVLYAYLGENPMDSILNSYNIRDFSLAQRLLTQCRVVMFYISLLVFPHPSRLNLAHDFPLSNSLMDPVTTGLSAIIIIGLIGLAVIVARKHRLLSFCILWFIIQLVIESSIIGLEIIYEHRTYLPSAFPMLLPVVAVLRIFRSKRVQIGILCAVVALFSVWSYQRNQVWQNKIAFWEDSIAKSPQYIRPYINLGTSYQAQGRSAEAMMNFRKALAIEPDNFLAHYNLGNVLSTQGDIEQAAEHYNKALPRAPSRFYKIYIDYGNVLIRLGRFEEAIEQYSIALKMNPENDQAHNNMGTALDYQGRLQDAIVQYSEALRLNPKNAEAHNNIGVAYRKLGRFDEAAEHYIAALGIDPNYAEAYNNLGIALLHSGKIKGAVTSFRLALEKRPDYPAARDNLAKALAIR